VSPLADPLAPERAVIAHAGAATITAITLLALNLRTIVASLPPLVTDIRADLGLSGAAGGLLTTLPVICFGALAPLAPALARHVSIERLLVACSFLTALAAALRGVGGVAGLYAGSLLAGAGVAVAQAALPALIRSRYVGQLGVLTGVFSMALPLGATIGAVLAVPLESLFGGWEASLAFWAVPAALAGALWLPAALGAGTTVHGPAALPLLRTAMAWWVSVFFGLQSMQFYAGLAWLPTILEDAGHSEATAGALLALSAIVQVVPAYVVPVVATSRARQLASLYAVTALAVAGVGGLLVAPGPAALWMILLGIGQGGVLGLALILPVLRGGDARTVASLMAMTLGVGYLMAANGPWLLGAVYDATGDWTVPLLVFMAICALQLVPGLPAARGRAIRESEG
jgi:CP family cyanate transporter-like MFS transporter